MASCKNKLSCKFNKRKLPVHDAVYNSNVAKYCDGTPESCAIYQVLAQASFLKVTDDLYPNQTFRVAKLVG